MRSSIPCDTHAFVKKLVAAGVPEPQAEVHAQALGELVIERLATKDVIQLLKDDLHALEERLEARLDSRLKDLELRLTLRRPSRQRDPGAETALWPVPPFT